MLVAFPVHTGAINRVDPATGVVAGLALGAVLLIAFALVARGRLTAPRGKVQQANDLADHREYERNLAQQELTRRLEEERELAREKLQFESQLAEYEKYASLAQLAPGGCP